MSLREKGPAWIEQCLGILAWLTGPVGHPLSTSPLLPGPKSCVLKLAHFILLLATSSGLKRLGISSNQYAFDLRPTSQVMARRGLKLSGKTLIAWPGLCCHLRVC